MNKGKAIAILLFIIGIYWLVSVLAGLYPMMATVPQGVDPALVIALVIAFGLIPSIAIIYFGYRSLRKSKVAPLHPGTQSYDESTGKEKFYGLIALLIGIILLIVFYSMIKNSFLPPFILYSISTAVFCIPSLMLFIIGFQMLLGKTFPFFERVFPMALRIFGVYIMLAGLLLFIFYFWGMVTQGIPAYTVISLTCALIVLIGNHIFQKGKAEAEYSRKKA